MGSETDGHTKSRIKWRGRQSLAILCGAALLLQACTIAPYPYVEKKTRASFGKIGLVSASFTPEFKILDSTSTLEYSAVGMRIGILGGQLVLLAALSSCFFASPTCLATIPLGGVVVGGAVGAAIGSAQDSKTNTAAQEALGPVIEMQLVQDALRAQVMAYATQHGIGPLAVIDDPLPSILEGSPDYRHLSGKGIDTLLEVRLLQLDLRKVTGYEVRYKPGISARARVIRVSDNAILSDQTYSLSGEEVEIDIWGSDNGRRFQIWFEYAYATLASYMLDEMILGYLPKSDNTFRTTVDSGASLSNEEDLHGFTGFGLRPDNPELRKVESCSVSRPLYGLAACNSRESSASLYQFTEIGTLWPEFRWNSLVGAEPPDNPELRKIETCSVSRPLYGLAACNSRESSAPLDQLAESADDRVPEGIQDVNYEIQLFTAQHTNRGIVPELLGGPIYNRNGLVEPRHRIEQSLNSCTKYFWTVRAHFRIDRQPRLTEWANSYGRPWELRRPTYRIPIRLPTDYYLPFRTHCPANAGAD